MANEDNLVQRSSEELSDISWNYHRERQLKNLGIDPEDIDD